ERHILLALSHGKPRDTRVAAGRPHRMRRIELIQTQNFCAAPGQLIRRRRAHGAEAQNRNVKRMHSLQSNLLCSMSSRMAITSRMETVKPIAPATKFPV